MHLRPLPWLSVGLASWPRNRARPTCTWAASNPSKFQQKLKENRTSRRRFFTHHSYASYLNGNSQNVSYASTKQQDSAKLEQEGPHIYRFLSLKAFPQLPPSPAEDQENPGIVTQNALLSVHPNPGDSINQVPGTNAPPTLSLPSRSLDDFDRFWTQRIQRLSNGENEDLFIRDPENLTHDLQRLLAPSATPKKLDRAWNRLQTYSDTSKTRLWDDMMLWTLQNNPKRAAELLLITKEYSQLRVSRYKVADCLNYLAHYYLDSHRALTDSIIDLLRQLTYDLLLAKDHDILGNLYLPDAIANLLLHHGDSRTFLRDLMRSPVTLDPNTVLHCVDKSIEWGDFPASLRLLRSIVRCGSNDSQPQIQAACVKVVRVRSDPVHQDKVRMNLLTELLEMGIRPCIALYNAMLLTVIESGDQELAWRMFELSKASGLAPDAITYGLMLKSAKLSQDHEILQQLLGEIESDSSVVQNEPRLLSDVLNTIYYRSLEMETPAFPEMLRLYSKFCMIKPLQELGICNSEPRLHAENPIAQLPPTPHILGQMIGAYVMNNSTSDRVIRVYNQYHQLVNSGHALISPVAKWDYVANGFMLAFGTRESTLRYCTIVVKHMLDAAHQSRERENQLPIAEGESLLADIDISSNGHSEHNSLEHTSNAPLGLDLARSERNSPEQPPPEQPPPEQSPPTVRTWTLLARAFFQHRQQIAAEKVLKLMQDHGIRPSDVTWNTFVTGYANLQDVEGAIDALNRMQAEQHDITTDTIKALSNMWDRNRLMEALEQSENIGVQQDDFPSNIGEQDMDEAVFSD